MHNRREGNTCPHPTSVDALRPTTIFITSQAEPENEPCVLVGSRREAADTNWFCAGTVGRLFSSSCNQSTHVTTQLTSNLQLHPTRRRSPEKRAVLCTSCSFVLCSIPATVLQIPRLSKFDLEKQPLSTDVSRFWGIVPFAVLHEPIGNAISKVEQENKACKARGLTDLRYGLSLSSYPRDAQPVLPTYQPVVEGTNVLHL